MTSRTTAPTTSVAALRLRLLGAAALVLCTIAFASAQQSGFYLGTKAGVNGSKFRFTEDLKELYPTSERLAGLSLGLEAGIGVGRWNFGTGFEYQQRGGTYTSEPYLVTDDEGFDATEIETARERTHVLTVPALVGYSDYLAGRVGYRVQVGPAFDIGLTGRIDRTIETFGEELPELLNEKVSFGAGVNDDYRKVQTSFRVNPEIWVDLARNHRLSVGATWDFGAADAFNPNYKTANEFFDVFRGDATNRTALVTVGYQYRLPFADRY